MAIRTNTEKQPRRIACAAALAVLSSGSLMLAGCTIGDVAEDIPADVMSSEDGPAPTRGGVASEENNTNSGEITATDLQDLALPDTTIAVAGVGSTQEVSVPAWSTIKVPLSIAAVRDGYADMSALTSAITVSDNAAAEQLWEGLGQPEGAAEKVERVLSEGGVQTQVSAQVTRPGFSAFGQTMWTTEGQATFASHLQCLAGAQSVMEAMGSIAGGQNYGLGQIPGAIYKGGWGPNESGAYGVRQFGLIPRGDGTFAAVAIAAVSPDGSYESSQVQLDQLAQKLSERAADLPATECSSS